MKKTGYSMFYHLTLIVVMIILAALTACSGNKTTTSTPTSTLTSTPTPTSSPAITITSPTGNVVPQIGNVTISVQVSDFTFADNLGKANAPGEGHIHYFMDVDAPTTPGRPAVTEPGTYAATSATSYTWNNVGGGTHRFSVELVNNDHSPLVPPVVATISLTVLPEIGPPSLIITVPRNGATLAGGSVLVSVQVSNFNLVEKLGSENAPREGHIHYFIDVPPPTDPTKPAVSAPGSYAATADTSYTWSNVTVGSHSFAAELVNNNHTPLDPPVTASVLVTVAATTPTSTPTPPPTTTSPPPTTTTPPAPPPTTGQSVTLDLVTRNFAFDKPSLTVPAGARVIINFDNQDGGIPHNFALYTSSSASSSIFIGQIISGSNRIIYEFTAPATPGNYFFRCDVHPSMNGTFIVQ
ncbi:MAG: hypothetical protein A2Z29_01425 [Chloroflexi bacterium RBG_16_56_11]|nr:MAG: hypothetical protein A2Z29_01425 [Chloroflexi bacterium RBG_16_56_11]